jgi:hypothetical protein
MACDRFVGAIRARALGTPLRADVAAHLAVCSGCQSVLEVEERLMTVIDVALNDVRSARPAPDFVSHVRARVERASRWTPRGWWAPAAIAVAGVVVIAVVSLARVPREPSAVRQTSSMRPPAQSLLAPRQQAADRTIVPAPATSTRRPRVRRQQIDARASVEQTAEVLVPAQQREAVSRLFASLRAGRPEVVSMLMSLHAAESATTEAHGVTIPPLRIEPVVVSILPSPASVFEK